MVVLNKRADALYRAREIARRLSHCDIVGFSEAFEKHAREQLIDEFRAAWGSDFQVVEPPATERSEFGLDSGLLLITRLPVVASHSLKYDNDSSPLTHGIHADGFAAKGALHARLTCSARVGSDYLLDVFLTHMESLDPNIRQAQFPLFSDFVQKFGDRTRPVLMLGDFNTDGRPVFQNDANSQYRRLISHLQACRTDANLVDLWLKFSTSPGGTNSPGTEDGGERLDYIFVSNPKVGPVLHLLSVRVDQMLDPHVVSLSDHSAVRASLEWR